jgi:hypothetical protein
MAAVSTLRDAGGAQGGHIGFAAAGSDFTATQPGGGPLYGTLDLF